MCWQPCLIRSAKERVIRKFVGSMGGIVGALSVRLGIWIILKFGIVKNEVIIPVWVE
jgi:hypothetical protein